MINVLNLFQDVGAFPGFNGVQADQSHGRRDGKASASLRQVEFQQTSTFHATVRLKSAVE